MAFLSFYYFDDFLFRAEIFNFHEVPHINDIDVISKKSSPTPRASKFSPMLFSVSFIVLHFIFRSVIYLESIFMQNERFLFRFIILLHADI